MIKMLYASNAVKRDTANLNASLTTSRTHGNKISHDLANQPPRVSMARNIIGVANVGVGLQHTAPMNIKI
jgi:hypothetical protein